jgi:uncharacterized protein YjhX (UPF0386 family)
MFRLNAFDPVTGKERFEFYFKPEEIDEKDRRSVICNFCAADEGLYYYRTQSRILTPKENKYTRNTFDGFMSMETLKNLFEMLKKAHLVEYEGASFKITRKGKQVIIEEGHPSE